MDQAVESRSRGDFRDAHLRFAQHACREVQPHGLDVAGGREPRGGHQLAVEAGTAQTDPAAEGVEIQRRIGYVAVDGFVQLLQEFVVAAADLHTQVFEREPLAVEVF